MHKERARKFYKSKRWLRSRAAYISDRIMIDGGLCEHCKKRIGQHVDHKIEITINNITDPDIMLNPENYQYLCIGCHTRKTKRGQPEFLFDEDGRPVEL